MLQQYSGIPDSWRFAVGCYFFTAQFELIPSQPRKVKGALPEEEAAERLGRQAVKPTAMAHASQRLDPVPEPASAPTLASKPVASKPVASKPPDASATIAPVPVSEAAFPSRTEANPGAGVSTRFECVNEKDVKNLKEMAEDGQSIRAYNPITVYASPPFSKMKGKPSPEHPP